MQKRDEEDAYSLEIPNTCDLVTRMDNCRSSTLGSHQNNVDHVRCRRHRVKLLEVVHRHLLFTFSLMDRKVNRKVRYTSQVCRKWT